FSARRGFRRGRSTQRVLHRYIASRTIPELRGNDCHACANFTTRLRIPPLPVPPTRSPLRRRQRREPPLRSRRLPGVPDLLPVALSSCCPSSRPFARASLPARRR